MRTRWLSLGSIAAICVIGWWWWSAAPDESGPGDAVDRRGSTGAAVDGASDRESPPTSQPESDPAADQSGRVAVGATLAVVAAENGAPIVAAQVECVDRAGQLRSTLSTDANGLADLSRDQGFAGLVVSAAGRQRLAFEPGMTRVELPTEAQMAVEVRASAAVHAAFRFETEPPLFVAAEGVESWALQSLLRASAAPVAAVEPLPLDDLGRGLVSRPIDVAGELALGARHRLTGAHAVVARARFTRDAREVVFDLGERSTFTGVILQLPAPTLPATRYAGTLMPPFGDRAVTLTGELAAGTTSIPFVVLPGSAGTAELGSVRIGAGSSLLVLENYELELIDNVLVELAPWSITSGASLDVTIEGLDPSVAALVELELQPARIDPTQPQFAYRLAQTGPIERRFDALTASGLYRIELAPAMRDLGFSASAVAVDIAPGVATSGIPMPIQRFGHVRVLLPTSPGDLTFESLADGARYEHRVVRDDFSMRLPVGHYRAKFRADQNGLEADATFEILAPELREAGPAPRVVEVSLQ